MNAITSSSDATLRRRILRGAVGLAVATVSSAWTLSARASAPASRRLSLLHTHTLERIDLVYAVGASYVPGALSSLNRFLRDHYTGDVGVVDPGVFDLLHAVQRSLGDAGAFEVISGYRCPATNGRLRASGGGGVAKHSLHMDGRAIDIRLPGVALADLREAAVSARGGGVGFYPGQRFVHLDTGRVRSW